MGRCYEFGVLIAEGCDHAMAVPEEGGKCVCVGCGTPCTGKFEGCGVIMSQPGYVPAMAPEWARTAEVLPPPTEDVVSWEASWSASSGGSRSDEVLLDLRGGGGVSGPSPARTNGHGWQTAQEVASPVAHLTEPPPATGISRDEFLQALAALRAEIRATRAMVEGLVAGVDKAAPAIREAFLEVNESLHQELSAVRSALENPEEPAPISREEFHEANESLRQELVTVRSALENPEEPAPISHEEFHEANELLRQELVAVLAASQKPDRPAPLSRQEFFQAYGLLRNEVLNTLTKVERAADDMAQANAAPPNEHGIEPSSSSAWLRP